MRDPFSLEAEHGLLGAMLIEQSMIDVWSDGLRPDHFYWEDHGVMFNAIVTMAAEGKLIDAVTLSDYIGPLPSGQPTLAYCAEIQYGVKSAANGGEYAKIVLERSMDRLISEVAREIHEISTTAASTNDKVAAVQSQISRLDDGDAVTEVVDLASELNSYVDELERRRNLNGKMDGLETGLADLDERLCGLKPEEVMVAAGRAKMGKTTFAMGIVRHNAIRRKKHCLVFSLEMSKNQLLDRILAAEAGVKLELIQNGTAPDLHPVEITAGMAKMRNMDMKVVDKAGVTMSRIRTMARRLNNKRKLDLILIDHIGLLVSDDKRADTRQIISDATRQAKLMAKELKVPVILVSQLNRANESRPNKRPMPSDLRDSGTIEQDADMVIFVHREDYYNPDTKLKGIGEIILSIARSVQPGTFYTLFQGSFNRFVDLAPGYQIERDEPQERGRSHRGMQI